MFFSHSIVSDSVTPGTAAHQASLSITSSQSLLKLMFIESVMHPTISVVPLSSFLQSFPASGSFQMSQFFASSGQSVGVSASDKGEKERYTHLNAEFQRIARRDKKVFLSDQCKEIEENNRMGKTSDLFKKIRDTKGTFHATMGTIGRGDTRRAQ